MKIHRLSVDEALEGVGSCSQGLSSVEALYRLRTFGPNRIETVARRHPALRLLAEFAQFFSLILWVAAALAFTADWYVPGQGMAQVGYAVVAVIVVSGLFSFWQEHRIEQTLAALQKLLPQNARRNARRLSRGVAGRATRNGRRHPPAGRGQCSRRLSGDRSSSGRESTPQQSRANRSRRALSASAAEKKTSSSARTSSWPAPRWCRADAGRSSSPRARTPNSARLPGWRRAGSAAPSPLRKQLAQLSRLIAILAVAIGTVFFAIGAAIGVPIWQDFIFSIGIIVAMVPEGLLPTLTLALVLAAQRMAKRNVLIRDLASVETLGFTTVICTDKTGHAHREPHARA